MKIQLEKGQCDWLASIYSRTLQLENLFTRVLKEAIERRTFVDTLYQVMGWVPIALDHFTFFTPSSLKMRSFSPSKPTCRVDIMINPSVEKGFKNKCRFYLLIIYYLEAISVVRHIECSSVQTFDCYESKTTKSFLQVYSAILYCVEKSIRMLPLKCKVACSIVCVCVYFPGSTEMWKSHLIVVIVNPVQIYILHSISYLA